jgi:hypothetical protein
LALAALKGAPAPALKAKWRELFDSEPPPYNRRFMESRLAYRILQEVTARKRMAANPCDVTANCQARPSCDGAAKNKTRYQNIPSRYQISATVPQ